MNIKLKPFLAPLFIAIAGSSASISVMDSMNLLGADMSRARLRHAIDVLGGVGKKKLKKMEKAYQQLSWKRCGLGIFPWLDLGSSLSCEFLFGALAQLGERNTGSVEVSGSIPLGSTKNQSLVLKCGGFFLVLMIRFWVWVHMRFQANFLSYQWAILCKDSI